MTVSLDSCSFGEETKLVTRTSCAPLWSVGEATKEMMEIGSNEFHAQLHGALCSLWNAKEARMVD